MSTVLVTESTVEIHLAHGLVTIVDRADYDSIPLLRGRGWFAHKPTRNCRTFYAALNVCLPGRRQRKVYMHRLIAQTPVGVKTDHIDRNGLNNRRSNLRVCTHAQNTYNQGPRGNRRFKGITWSKAAGKWAAQIVVGGKNTYLGLFLTEEDAALAYNEAAKRLHGEFAFLNVVG